MANRKLQLVSPEVGLLLVKQLAHELKNYNLYLSYANYFAVEGITSLEKYYQQRAYEELNHSQWITKYLSEADYKYMMPAVEKNTEQVNNYLDPFIQTIDREILTTEMIYSIYKQCQTEGDLMTCSWLLEQLIKEQREEENISRMARTIMEESSDIFIKANQILNLLNL